MKETNKIKHVSDVDMRSRKINVQKPFRIQKEKQRQFIRLEISSPMKVRQLKDIFGTFRPQDAEDAIDGTVMNISSGGLLVELTSPLNEGDIVVMRFSLQEVETLDNVLGIVKRVDLDEEATLAGIQFIDKEFLADKLTLAELEMLDDRFTNFHQTIRTVLNKYVEQQTSLAGV